jgi:hypothetical protein
MARRNNLKLTPELEKQIFWFVQNGQHVSRAAEAVGLTSQAISMRRKRDPEFDLRVRQAEAKFQMGLLARHQQAIERGDTKAIEWMLERRWPAEWGRALARDANETLSAQDIVEGIHNLLAAVGGRHAPKDAKDVDADEPESGPAEARAS